MFLYCTHSTPRLQYVANFIGNILLGTPFIVTTNRDDYKRAALSKINYSAERIAEEEVWIKPHELLFEKKIKPQRINCFEWNNNKVFFKTEGHLPFDIFAATFYLLSRYEEYLPHTKDEYGRFAHANSLAYKEGFLNQPLINKWIFEFGRLLEKMFPSFTTHHSAFSFLPTYDIDEAYAYKYKPWWKNVGGIIKAILKADFNSANFRLKVLTNKRNDPYDSYKWMDDLHENFKLKPIYFFLVAQKNRVYDRNILPNKPALQQLIKEQAAKYEVGIHPSWQSGDSEILLLQEKNYIAELTGKRVSKSRQHYIRLTIPHTYRKLIAVGITEDYSMGYGSTNGFRASVASPFYWYDLENEEQTNLLIYPFCFMDANAYYEQKLSAQAAYDEMLQYYHEVKAVNGLFITLWHNNFLGHFSPLKQWKATYVKFIKKIME
ncbi:MAG: hypothetical protein RL115_492 [Bacteroidota bacterium]|jgi:hypothetical protein